MIDSRLARIATACLLLAAVAMNTTGCMGPAGPANDQPPDIPPASTMVMDFSEFNGSGNAKVIPDGRDPQTAQVINNGNWGWSAIHVGVWSVIITVGLAVPVGSFAESFNHVPEQLDDGTWVWSYDTVVSGITYSAELHGLAVDGDIHWDMYVTKAGDYENFHWFSGVSNLAGTAGTWTLNNSPNDPQPLLQIDWTRDLTTNTGDIRYTNVVPNDPENGGYIYYGSSTGNFDTFYEIYNKGQDNTMNIEWNRDPGDGRVKDASHFGDDLWHCWAVDQTDTNCS